LFKRCSTCFGQNFAHHQERFRTAPAASGSRIEAKVDVFPAVVCLLVAKPLTNRPRLVPFIRRVGLLELPPTDPKMGPKLEGAKEHPTIFLILGPRGEIYIHINSTNKLKQGSPT
jgi:hypothetical protein